jgi:hypothetical protein
VAEPDLQTVVSFQISDVKYISFYSFLIIFVNKRHVWWFVVKGQIGVLYKATHAIFSNKGKYKIYQYRDEIKYTWTLHQLNIKSKLRHSGCI